MKKLLFALAVLVSTSVIHAQDEEAKGFSKDKLFAGGGIGLSFGNYTLINLSPQVGYRFNKYVSSGIGLNLIYASQKEKYNGLDYSKTVRGIAGIAIFGRFYPAQKFLIQLQPEVNYTFGNQIFYQPVKETYKLDTELVPSLLAGGGLVTPTQHGAIITTVMYDVLQDPKSPYGKRPIINVGYNFNF
jgi:hypothetical protein